MTMLVVSHEMGFAREVAHRIVFMEAGFIVETGPPQQLFEAPRSERARQFLSMITRSRNGADHSGDQRCMVADDSTRKA
jgi:polar amino acid transport system ATP-binding protein